MYIFNAIILLEKFAANLLQFSMLLIGCLVGWLGWLNLNWLAGWPARCRVIVGL